MKKVLYAWGQIRLDGAQADLSLLGAILCVCHHLVYIRLVHIYSILCEIMNCVCAAQFNREKCYFSFPKIFQICFQ